MTANRLVVALLFLVGTGPAHGASAVELDQGALGNIFVEGESVAIPVHAEGDELQWNVRDFLGAQVESGTLPLTGESGTIRPSTKGPGYFTLEVSAKTRAQPVAQAQTPFAIVHQAKATGKASPFGVMTHFAKGWPRDIIPLIEKAGIRHVRDEQPWDQVERERGQYKFPPRLTAYVSELSAHQLDPLIVLAFANRLYDGGQTPHSDSGRAGYAAYATAVARQYQGSLPAVEIWNEYNGNFCEGPCRRDRPGYYTSMLRETYRQLKAANPSLTVIGGAAVPIPLDYFRGLFEKGALDAMDAVVIHPYRPRPEGVEEAIEGLRRLMAQYGRPKPIWATEFSDLADMRRNRDGEASYLVRMSTLLLSAKVERIYWYLMRDYPGFRGLGLVRGVADPLGRYAVSPAYVAYSTLIYQLTGANFVRREPSDPSTRIYLFSEGGNEIRIVWSTRQNATYDLAGDQPVRKVSLMGEEQSISPRDGRISLTINQNPIYLISSPAGRRAGIGAQ